ncbi:hypothetical protein B0H11DRAFT_2255529 [Mycena galericulata]|nr:hypothetical protein B0H11DRAFT_2256241 [Mycena galericulata]KAJ7437303.1 hypothetical protein B0H11DRAFT_2255529 [Mycena galericulata]
MSALDDSSDYDDAEIVALIASLDLTDPGPPSSPPGRRPATPRTPSPRPPRLTAETPTSSSLQASTIYHFYSPTKRGVTTEWSVAGAATQGVPGAHVTAESSGQKKKGGTKKAYVVFCGRQCGVFRTWNQVKPLVDGVSSCIFRGYTSRKQAEAAYQYALSRSWIRNCFAPIVASIPELPQPLEELQSPNPLNRTEPDDRWYIVYRGIKPGVYRSHLESQLNTLGVRGALHESIKGKDAALAKYAHALRRGEVAVVSPPYPDDVFL